MNDKAQAPLDATERRALDAMRTGRCRTLDYRGIGGGPARCDLAIATDAAGIVVMFSERDDNPGTSVTNWIENLAAEVHAKHFPERDPRSIRWLERYPARPSIAERETVDRVALQWDAGNKRFHSPQWERAPLDAAHVARGR